MSMYIYIYMYEYIRICIYIYIQIYRYMFIHTYMYTHTYAYIHLYVFTHRHIWCSFRVCETKRESARQSEPSSLRKECQTKGMIAERQKGCAKETRPTRKEGSPMD